MKPLRKGSDEVTNESMATPGLDQPEERLMAELLTARSLKLPQRRVAPHNLTLILERISWDLERKRQRTRSWLGIAGWGIAASLAGWLMLGSLVSQKEDSLAKAEGSEDSAEIGFSKVDGTGKSEPNQASPGGNLAETDAGNPENKTDPRLPADMPPGLASKQTLPEMERQLRHFQQRLQRLEELERDRSLPAPDLARLMVVELSDPAAPGSKPSSPGELAERVLALMSRNLTLRIQKPGQDPNGESAAPTVAMGNASQRNPTATDPDHLDGGGLENGTDASNLALNQRTSSNSLENEASDVFITYDQTLGQGMLIVGNMPALVEGQSYQLWVKNPTDGSLSSPGLLPPQENGGGPVSFSLGKPGPAPSEFFISLENSPNGATMPSGDILRRWSAPVGGTP